MEMEYLYAEHTEILEAHLKQSIADRNPKQVRSRYPKTEKIQLTTFLFPLPLLPLPSSSFRLHENSSASIYIFFWIYFRPSIDSLYFGPAFSTPKPSHARTAAQLSNLSYIHFFFNTKTAYPTPSMADQAGFLEGNLKDNSHSNIINTDYSASPDFFASLLTTPYQLKKGRLFYYSFQPTRITLQFITVSQKPCRQTSQIRSYNQYIFSSTTSNLPFHFHHIFWFWLLHLHPFPLPQFLLSFLLSFIT